MALPPSLADLKTYLNISSTSQDTELGSFLDAAVAAVEALIGPIVGQDVAEDIYRHGGNVIRLNHLPVQSVSYVGVAMYLGATPVDDTASWAVDQAAGLLRRKVAGGYLGYYGPGSVVSVTYRIGRSVVSADIEKAILLESASMWRSQRGASPSSSVAVPAGGSGQPPQFAGFSGALSDDVMALLSPYLLPPGVG